MPSTIEAKEAVKNILYQNWKLHGDLSRNNVPMSTGVSAPSRKYPSIECIDTDTPSKVMTTIWLERKEVVQVHVWVRPRTTSKDDLEKAKQLKHLLVEEVTRIMWSYQIQMQDLSWAHPFDSINADQYHAVDEDVGEANRSSAPESRGDFTPILHEIVMVETIRFYNAYTGGTQMNRTT
jgi:hypothetical protein